jgi:hypothetical protein
MINAVEEMATTMPSLQNVSVNIIEHRRTEGRA